MELTQLKEEFVMERQSNELTVKKMMVDMEETVAANRNIEDRRDAAFRVIYKAFESPIKTGEIEGIDMSMYKNNSTHEPCLQCNLRIKDTLGRTVTPFVERTASLQRV